MDSLTQIVLGAAVGEVVLGKKIGNKAMLWGAIAGTIPDLDVYQSLLYDSLKANELHRGISHSLVFSIFMAPLLAWLARTKEKWSLVGFITIILAYPFITISSSTVRIVLFAVWALVVFFILKNKYTTENASQKDWTKLAFWSLVTHPLLDCHTTWGTQFLWPLPTKFAWNNIFVVDPLYTVPFILFVAAAMFFKRQSKTRAILNYTGIVISSAYMLWSLGAKYYTYTIFEQNLQEQEIKYSRLTTVPTPLNTFLWSATADGDTVLYSGLYSIFDKDQKVEFHTIKTNHELVGSYNGDDVLNRLNFLSKGWYVINNDNPDTLVYNDARFGPMYLGDKPMYGFGYQLTDKPAGVSAEAQRPDPDNELMSKMLSTLWNRIWGK
jgi:inner membrane protein